MPFVSVNRPSLATTLCSRPFSGSSVECDVHNLFVSFAERIGILLYEQLAVFSDRQLAGERVFVAGLFGPDFTPELELPSGYEPADTRETPEITRQRLREAPALFLDDCLEKISWPQYRIVGFSTMFEQNIASLALARRIKQRWPDTIIVFGGANCEGEMGLELLREFRFVDYVCSREGDTIFPELVKCLLAGRPSRACLD